MAAALGDRLAHVHLADGIGLGQGRAPGARPRQPAVRRAAGGRLRRGFAGNVVVEVNTRRCTNRAEREADLAEALAFTRLHLAAPPGRCRAEAALTGHADRMSSV